MQYEITPVPKPRMTQRDKWQKRPAVLRYRDFCDRVREHDIELSDQGCSIKFLMPMPKSWSQKKRDYMDGQPHQQKPDLDNLLKSLFDAVHKEDCGIWHIDSVCKVWAKEGGLDVQNSNKT